MPTGFARHFSAPTTAPNRVWVVEAVSAEGIAATENREPLTRTPELNVLESPLQKESNPRPLSFPLEVGKPTYWYAPAARAIVKSIHHNPYLGTSTVELVGYRLLP